MTDSEFVAAFEDCTLPDDAFHHGDHIRLTWIYLRSCPLFEALARVTAGLRRFAAWRGKPERYHETITLAFCFLIYERMQQSEADAWEEFAERNADLFRWNPSVLHAYYRPETLASDHARSRFVLPDLG